jgi:uncharacterized delta-60 repeat protein
MKLIVLLTLAFFQFTFLFSQDGQNDSTFNIFDSGRFGDGSGINSPIYSNCVQADGKIIIVGGFTGINGSSTYRIARLNSDNSLDSTFIVGTGFNEETFTSAVQSDGKILVGGFFTNYNGTSRNKIVRLNSNGVIDLSFNIGTGFNGYINCVKIQTDGKILVGGNFSLYNGISKNNIIRLNNNGSIDTAFNIGNGFNGIVNSITILDSGKIVVGGNFTSYNFIASNRLIRLNPNGNIDSSFILGTGYNQEVTSIAVQNNGKIIVGGNFTAFNGFSANRIICLNVNGSVDSLFVTGTGFNSTVKSLDIFADGKIIIGGNFTSYDGQNRNKIVKIDSSGQVDLLFDVGSGFNNTVYHTNILDNGSIIISGWFTSYNETERKYIIKLTLSGSIDNSFNEGSGFNNSFIDDLKIQNDGKILVGGLFTKFNGSNQKYLARLNTDGSLDSTFNIGTGFNYLISTFDIQSDGKIIVGGGFTSYNGFTQNRITRLNIDGSIDLSFNTGTGFNNSVSCIKIQSDGKILVGGDFTTYNGYLRNRLVRLNSDGTIDLTFATGNGFNDFVNCIYEQVDGKILIGGYFSNYNLISYNNIVRLNSNGIADLTFNVGTGFVGSSSYVQTIDVQADNKIIIGGKFIGYNGTAKNNITRLNPNGIIDLTFNIGSGFNDAVSCTEILPNGKVMISGVFSSFNGNIRNKIVRLNSNGTLDLSFNSNLGFEGVNAQFLEVQSDGKIIVAGFFKKYNGKIRNRICRINSSICTNTYNTLSISSCDSFTWLANNQTYTTSGVYQCYLTNSSGCDSIITLNLTILNSTINHDTIINCNTYTWPINGFSYNVSGNYYDTLLNTNGCDSIFHLNLVISNTSQHFDTITSCTNFLWQVNGLTYNYSGDYIDTLLNVFGCDSILNLHLTILPSYYSSETVTSCTSYQWSQNSQTYYSSGNYYDTLTSINGCDSIIELNLTVFQVDSLTETIISCDSLTWINGITYFTSTNSPYFTLTNSNGCDSIINLNLTIIPSTISSTNTFSSPSSNVSCTGQLIITTTGNPNFDISIDGSAPFSSSGYSLQSNLCQGIHELSVVDYCGDTVSQPFVIPIDSNYVFNNPFIDSIAVDSLGTTITNCDIYYNSIDTAFIDSLWATGNQVNVIWNIVDSNGSNLDTTTYDLNNGSGVYWLQLSVFCPTKAVDDYFTVTQAIYFGNGGAYLVGLEDNPELENSIGLYPNPTSNSVTITFESNSTAHIQLMDAQGKFILENSIVSGQSVSLEELERGVYFISLEIDNQQYIERIIKQ